MARSAPLALALLLLAGCVSTQPVSLGTPDGRARVNARAERGHPVLALYGGRGRQVRALHVGPDVTTWVDKRTGEARSAPTASVAAVTFRRDGAGALRGAAVGVGLGVALGLVAGVTDDDRGLIDFSTGTFVSVFGASGALIGAVGGAIHSDRAVYRAVPDRPIGAGDVSEGCGGPPLACAAHARPAAVR
jgi:hypothetical protein